jgi:hypothetical protein
MGLENRASGFTLGQAQETNSQRKVARRGTLNSVVMNFVNSVNFAEGL